MRLSMIELTSLSSVCIPCLARPPLLAASVARREDFAALGLGAGICGLDRVGQHHDRLLAVRGLGPG